VDGVAVLLVAVVIPAVVSTT